MSFLKNDRFIHSGQAYTAKGRAKTPTGLTLLIDEHGNPHPEAECIPVKKPAFPDFDTPSDRYDDPEDDGFVVPPPSKPYPIRTKRKVQPQSIVGKKKNLIGNAAHGWVGYVHNMSGDLAYVQWMYEKESAALAAQDLIVLDYGEETAAVLKAIGVKVSV